MPTHRSMQAAGMTEEQIAQAQAKVLCYVCGTEVVGLAQRDRPRQQAETVSFPDGHAEVVPPAPPDVLLGVRHRGCPPSEHAVASKKVWISGRVHIAVEGPER